MGGLGLDGLKRAGLFVAAAALVAGGAACAAARPDLLIKTEAEPNAAYGLEGAFQAVPEGAQVRSQATSATLPAVYFVKVRNAGDKPATFCIRATAAQAKGWTVKCTSGAADITAGILGQGYTTRSLAPAASEILTLSVTPDNSVEAKAAMDVIVNAFGDAAAKTADDSVKASTVATGWQAYYVSPTGAATNDGSIANPWSLAHVFSNPPAITPGATVWLRGGTYEIAGGMVSRLAGTQDAPVKLRQYPGEVAVLDTGNSSANHLFFYGAYCWYWGFTVKGSGTNRGASETNGAGIEFGKGGDPPILGQRGINLIQHDCNGQIGWWANSIDGELNGNIIYFNGFDDPKTRGHGHCIYTQNDTGRKLIKNNVTWAAYSFGIHGYTQGGTINNYDVIGNISFENGAASAVSGRTANIIWANKPFTGINVKGNLCYMDTRLTNTGTSAIIGIWQQAKECVIADNWFIAGRTALDEWVDNLKMTGNTFVGQTSCNKGKTAEGQPIRLANPQETYPDNKWLTAERKGVFQFVLPSDYEPSRAYICVYNFDNADKAEVDVSAVPGLQAGDEFEVYDIQNLAGPKIASGTFDGAKISLPLNLTAVVQPTGQPHKEYVHTLKEFNAFLLKKPGR